MINKKGNEKDTTNHGFIVNEKIKENEVRVIGPAGENLGILEKNDAITLALSQNLDLVQISKDNAGAVTAKIMDLGKFIYEKKKQQNEAKKKTKVIEIKEIKFRPVIGESDYNLKVSKIIEFLKDGDNVKITLQFRGRELNFKAGQGPLFFERVLNDVRNPLSGYNVDYQKELGMGNTWTKVLVAKKK